MSDRISEAERAIRHKLMTDFRFYAYNCLKIRTKNMGLTKFRLNKAQLYMHDLLQKQKKSLNKVRAMSLKGRQLGISTYVAARYYELVTTHFGQQAFILTHSLSATNNLFRIPQRFHENAPLLVKPQVSTNNTKSLIFGGLDSGYSVGTAETKNIGRSATIQLFHGSEVAFWRNAAEHVTGIMQAIPSEGSEVIIESTANGVGNYFHEMWQKSVRGETEFLPIFLPWFWETGYQLVPPQGFTLTGHEKRLQSMYNLTEQQLAWRRGKIAEMSIGNHDGEKMFAQEFPCNADEAFVVSTDDVFIRSDIVMHARKFKAEKFGALVMGVDPARFGDDRTSIIFRQGRHAFDLKSYSKKDTMEVTGIVHTLIQERRPFRVFVDLGGLGAGIVDRLYELGHRDTVVGINSGAVALNQEKYSNKRAEMWGVGKEWFEEFLVQIPDSDSLHADLCGIKYTYDSNGRLVMEKKSDMKKRGLRSPDEADALLLTFAMPVSLNMLNETSSQQVLQDLARDLANKSNARNNSYRM
jgi:hypothetical protein